MPPHTTHAGELELICLDLDPERTQDPASGRPFAEILAPVTAVIPPCETEEDDRRFVDRLVAEVRRARKAGPRAGTPG